MFVISSKLFRKTGNKHCFLRKIRPCTDWLINWLIDRLIDRSIDRWIGLIDWKHYFNRVAHSATRLVSRGTVYKIEKLVIIALLAATRYLLMNRYSEWRSQSDCSIFNSTQLRFYQCKLGYWNISRSLKKGIAGYWTRQIEMMY